MQVLLLVVPESRPAEVEELSPLLPRNAEVAIIGVSVLFWFVVLFLVFSALAWFKRRRARASRA